MRSEHIFRCDRPVYCAATSIVLNCHIGLIKSSLEQHTVTWCSCGGGLSAVFGSIRVLQVPRDLCSITTAIRDLVNMYSSSAQFSGNDTLEGVFLSDTSCAPVRRHAWPMHKRKAHRHAAHHVHGFLSAVLTVLSVDKLYHKILFLSSL